MALQMAALVSALLTSLTMPSVHVADCEILFVFVMGVSDVVVWIARNSLMEEYGVMIV